MRLRERLGDNRSCGGARVLAILVFGLAISPQARAVITSNVQVHAGTVRSVMAPTGIGLHTSQYYNNLGNASLPVFLDLTGVRTLRYGGGGYADVYHWSEHRGSPWFGDPNEMPYLAGGTDFASFIGLLDQIPGGQTVVTVNNGSALKVTDNQSVVPDFGGQPKEAAAWVAYANADPNMYGMPGDIVLGLDEQGNDWKTAGYWARLRESTPAEYVTWAGDDGVYNSRNAFLAIDRGPIGVKYWEIGNETFGTGYYGGGDGYSVNYDVPYDGVTGRTGNANLSPTHYGQEVVQFSQLMKSIDPSIKIGAVLNTPPDDNSWGPGWNDGVLAQAANNVDFVMVHWYPQAGTNANGDNLLTQVRTKLPQMINGTTAGFDQGNNAGIRDLLDEYNIENSEIMVTEFNYFGTLNPTLENAAEALFIADSYASWLDMGVTSVQYLELLTKDFFTDEDPATAGTAYYAVSMVNSLVSPGESLVQTTSSHNDVRVHAARKADGSLGIMIVNANRTMPATVNVTVDGILLGTESLAGYQLVNGNDIQNPSSSSLGNIFTVSVPQRSILTYIIPSVGTPGDFDHDLDVDGDDFLLWQRGGSPSPLSPGDLQDWLDNYGTEPLLAASAVVPEPATCGLALVLAGLMGSGFRLRRKP